MKKTGHEKSRDTTPLKLFLTVHFSMFNFNLLLTVHGLNQSECTVALLDFPSYLTFYVHQDKDFL
jgi:hypothetical protein